MKISHSIQEARNIVKSWQKEGLSVGFVPTMGYLHEGHCSLMAEAKKHHDKVVVSIFVNPTQFGVNEDLDSYPRDLEGDQSQCKKEGVDLIFSPSVAEMYPNQRYLSVTMDTLTEELCGKTRPTHFSGVSLVVSKLFHIIPANTAYFGKKDAQQLAIIKRMVEELNFDVEIVGCPIVRDENGLALSSRNAYLTEEEKKAALILSQTLKKVKEFLDSGKKNGEEIRNFIKESISSQPLARLDYGEIVDAVTLQPVEQVTASVLVALAVYFGNTRLIDNMSYEL